MAKKTIEKKITLGRDAEGKLIRRNVRGKTKAEVEKKAFEMRQKWLEKSNRPVHPSSNLLLSAFSTLFLSALHSGAMSVLFAPSPVMR